MEWAAMVPWVAWQVPDRGEAAISRCGAQRAFVFPCSLVVMRMRWRQAHSVCAGGGNACGNARVVTIVGDGSPRWLR
jgi:hypothetical protein